MTIFFAIIAAIHVIGLYAMLFALRRAPVAVETSDGFQVIAEAEEVREMAHAHARTA
ncbi:MAG TPA: hypothetical protein VK178_15690 [Opitutaceae bacterium]|nr:hypothetical protein [Opitutaceae bacterium]